MKLELQGYKEALERRRVQTAKDNQMGELYAYVTTTMQRVSDTPNIDLVEVEKILRGALSKVNTICTIQYYRNRESSEVSVSK